jgi:transcriptional regulator with XRE-family HTH domain
MADAGHFLRDARETAGMSIKDLSESLGLSDKTVLEDIESGQTIMPLELMLRSASLLARHDPIPFLIKFMRTYNPALEKTLEQWGVLALPKHYERERRTGSMISCVPSVTMNTSDLSITWRAPATGCWM